MVRITIEADTPKDILELLESLRETTYADTNAEGAYHQLTAPDDDDDEDDTREEVRLKTMGFDLSRSESVLSTITDPLLP